MSLFSLYRHFQIFSKHFYPKTEKKWIKLKLRLNESPFPQAIFSKSQDLLDFQKGIMKKSRISAILIHKLNANANANDN